MTDTWKRYRELLSSVPSLELTLDPSRMRIAPGFLEETARDMDRAYADMEALEKGAIANPDEKRMVGHYWLRDPARAPSPEIRAQIEKALEQIRSFAAGVHEGRIRPPGAQRFTQVLVIGIGGSALGPLFVADALGDAKRDRMRVHFIDNTDPDGIDRVLAGLSGKLPETLTIVTSKSGGTHETRNGLMYAAAAYRAAGLQFPAHAVAITMEGSRMDELARSEGWLARFPMFDWVGGRTSELSGVGLLPAALQGIDIDGLLGGAKACDEATRNRDTRSNPAAILALVWLHATGGKGEKDMVVLPYKDRLVLFSKYLQQLVMESLGKRLDVQGRRVDQGIAVYGNKGSTDQHAYVQQLRDGVNNFFVTFIRVLESGGKPIEVDPGITAGDYLHGFLLGTREALSGNDRESVTITVPRVDARVVGALVALFERAVGFYATLVGINAYHQPGVEAGKKAAAEVLDLELRVLEALGASPRTAEDLASAAGAADSTEKVYLLLEHLAANGRAKMARKKDPAETTFTRT